MVPFVKFNLHIGTFLKNLSIISASLNFSELATPARGQRPWAKIPWGGLSTDDRVELWIQLRYISCGVSCCCCLHYLYRIFSENLERFFWEGGEAVVYSPCNPLSTARAKQIPSHYSRMQIREVTKDWAVFVKLLNYGSYLLDSIKCLSILIQYYYMCVFVLIYSKWSKFCKSR